MKPYKVAVFFSGLERSLAGFIGANLVMELLRNTEKVRIVGLDSINDYYDVSIKH